MVVAAANEGLKEPELIVRLASVETVDSGALTVTVAALELTDPAPLLTFTQ